MYELILVSLSCSEQEDCSIFVDRPVDRIRRRNNNGWMYETVLTSLGNQNDGTITTQTTIIEADVQEVDEVVVDQKAPPEHTKVEVEYIGDKKNLVDSLLPQRS